MAKRVVLISVLLGCWGVFAPGVEQDLIWPKWAAYGVTLAATAGIEYYFLQDSSLSEEAYRKLTEEQRSFRQELSKLDPKLESLYEIDISQTITDSEDSNKSCCKFEWVPPRGGNPVHEAYAAKLNGGTAMDMLVCTSKGKCISYDAAIPGFGNPTKKPHTAIEAKTGHRWAIQPNPSRIMIASRAMQFAMQRAIASICKVRYLIAIDNQIGARGLKNHLPMFPIVHIP